MTSSRSRSAAALALAAALCAAQAGTARSEEPPAGVEPPPGILALLGPAGAPEPPAADRARIVASLAGEFRWTELVVAWNGTGDPLRADILLDAVAAAPQEARAEFFGIAAQPDVRRFLRDAALGVVRRDPGSAGMDRVMAIAAAIPEAERASSFTTGPLRDAVTARLRHAPDDLAPLRAAWAGLDPSLRDACIDGIAAAGPHGGTTALSTIIVEARGADAPSLARLALLPARSARPWAAGTHDAVRAALAGEDAILRRCGARLAGRIGGTAHVARLVELLGDAEMGADAQSALRAITGFDILADTALWTARLAEEELWAAKSWPAERAVLAGAAPPEARLAAIVRISERRIHAARIVPLLEPLVRESDGDVRIAAVRVLGSFGDPSAITVLSAAVRDPDQRVAAAASEALARITGLSAPALPADWRDELAL